MSERCNGRIFLNNSSIGLYPSAVAEREELRHRHGGGKWPAMFSACVDVVRRFPLLDVVLRSGEGTVALTTPFVFVGNNRYEMSLLSLGTRASLQGGELCVYLTRDAGRMGLLRLFFRALLGRSRAGPRLPLGPAPRSRDQDSSAFPVGLPGRRGGADGVADSLSSSARGRCACWCRHRAAAGPRRDDTRTRLRPPLRDGEPRGRRGTPRGPRVDRALSDGGQRRSDATGTEERVRGRTALPRSHPIPQARGPRQPRHPALRSGDSLRPPARPLSPLHRRGRGSLRRDGRGGRPGPEHRPVHHVEGRTRLSWPRSRPCDAGSVPSQGRSRRCS